MHGVGSRAHHTHSHSHVLYIFIYGLFLATQYAYNVNKLVLIHTDYRITASLFQSTAFDSDARV